MNRISVFLTILVLSCTVKTEKETSSGTSVLSSESLIGKVFTYGPEMDVTTCEIIAMCDCCAGNYLFINDEDFVAIDYCTDSKLYAAGKYEIKGDQIVLHFTGVQVDHSFNWEAEADTLSTEEDLYVIKALNAEPSTLTLTLLNCEKNLAFETGIEETPFVTLNPKYEFKDLLDQMNDDGIYQLLGLNR